MSNKIQVTQTLGEAFKYLRQLNKIKSTLLSMEINKSPSYISKFEKAEINSIDYDTFFELVSIISRPDNNITKSIELLLDYAFKRDIFFEEWVLDFDYFHRTTQIPTTYKEIIKTAMDSLQITTNDLCSYITQATTNNFNTTNLKEIDSLPHNKILCNENTKSKGAYFFISITEYELEDIINSTESTSCYAKLSFILFCIYSLQGAEKSDAYSKAASTLYRMGIYLYRDKYEIMFANQEADELNSILSGKKSFSLSFEDRHILYQLNNFTQHILSFAESNSGYTYKHLQSITKLLSSDPVLALKLMGTNLESLVDKPTSVKREFFAEVDELICKYSKKDVSDEIELL